ncbi:MAG TPA: hypothetical protein VM575_18795 [Nocardioides sp.]|jgi:hypothetical protein|nr:hypothetical protein [Nocardioides sp.]
MNDVRLDPGFDRALREELRTQVTRSASVDTRPRRRWVLLAAGSAVAACLAAVALLGAVRGDTPTHVSDRGTDRTTDSGTPSPGRPASLRPLEPVPDPLPGGDRVTHLGPVARFQETGSADLVLGPAPAGATHVEYVLLCLGDGHLGLPNGASATCGADGQLSDSVPIVAGAASYPVAADAGLEWYAEAVYSRHVTTPWAVNDDGDTYGVDNDRGSPDLVAVVADDGTEGYARRADLDGFTPRTPAEALEYQRTRAPSVTVEVVASDGRTVVGTMTVDQD